MNPERRTREEMGVKPREVVSNVHDEALVILPNGKMTMCGRFGAPYKKELEIDDFLYIIRDVDNAPRSEFPKEYPELDTKVERTGNSSWKLIHTASPEGFTYFVKGTIERAKERFRI